MQEDTFEAVKINVFALLGDLAPDLQGADLDTLLAKCTAAAAAASPDVPRAANLLRRLAISDVKARALLHIILPLCSAE